MELLGIGPPNAADVRIQRLKKSSRSLRQIDCDEQPLHGHFLGTLAGDSLLRSIAASARPVSQRGGKSAERLCQPDRNSFPNISVGPGKNRLTIFIIKPVK